MFPFQCHRYSIILCIYQMLTFLFLTQFLWYDYSLESYFRDDSNKWLQKNKGFNWDKKKVCRKCSVFLVICQHQNSDSIEIHCLPIKKVSKHTIPSKRTSIDLNCKHCYLKLCYLYLQAMYLPWVLLAFNMIVGGG